MKGSLIKAMKDFQIPMRVEVDKDTQNQTFGRFTTEAMNLGLGRRRNALRRVLLSSLTGAAVTTVKSNGSCTVFHDPGITEDVTSYF